MKHKTLLNTQNVLWQITENIWRDILNLTQFLTFSGNKLYLVHPNVTLYFTNNFYRVSQIKVNTHGNCGNDIRE